MLRQVRVKRLAFAIPTLQILTAEKNPDHHALRRKVKALILTPTRELAIQINESFEAYGRHTGFAPRCYFWWRFLKINKLKPCVAGWTLLLQTPGRLMDLFNQRFYQFSRHFDFYTPMKLTVCSDMGFHSWTCAAVSWQNCQ